MSFAQPIRRRPSASGTNTSPGWLTNGVARSAATGGGHGYGYAISPGGGGWMNGGGGGFSSGDWYSGNGRRETENNSRQHEQELINAYEAEDERIINVLSKKLEQLREDKIELENALEAESESYVNKLLRELNALRVTNRQLEARAVEAEERASSADTPDNRPVLQNPTANGRRSAEHILAQSPSDPSARTMLDAMVRENEQLRSRLVDAERNYARVTRLNEIYREELIEHRSRLGLSLDNLAGLTPSERDPLSQPIHLRPTRDSRSSSISATSSPASSVLVGSTAGQLQGFIGATASPRNPISRPPSQIHRPSHLITSPSPNPVSTPSAFDSPTDSSASQSLLSSPVSPFVPMHGRTAPIHLASASGAHSSGHRQERRYSSASSTSYAGSLTDATSAAGADPTSVSTGITSPPDSVIDVGGVFAAETVGGVTPQRSLSYPSVPPPSLSSSFGSPAAVFHIHSQLASQNSVRPRDPSMSPVEPRSRRGSVTQVGERRVAETGSLRRGSFRANAAESLILPIGGRVAESGSLIDVARSRANSTSATTDPATSRPSTVMEGDAEHLEIDV